MEENNEYVKFDNVGYVFSNSIIKLDKHTPKERVLEVRTMFPTSIIKVGNIILPTKIGRVM